MKRLLIFLGLACWSALFAGSQQVVSSAGLSSAAVEIAEIEARMLATREAGFPVDPAWQARLEELLPLVRGHAANVRVSLPSLPADNGFAEGAVIRPQALSPLEQQIRDLEFQMDGGYGSLEPDESMMLSLKDQLAGLYAQRTENRERNPLDQGADVCPATVVAGLPYTDIGTTVGRANNYTELDVNCPNSSNAPDVIYQFTPPATQSYTINTEGGSYDTYLYVNTSGACPGTAHVACDDDGGSGTLSSITETLNAGQVYYIVVDGFSTASGAYTLNVFDNCAVPCEPGDVLQCANEFRDDRDRTEDCNGACNNQSPIQPWQMISPYQTICGKIFTYVDTFGSSRRDTDFYGFTLTEACSLRIRLRSETATTILVGSGANTCPFSTYFVQSFSYPCSTVTFITQCFAPGNYTLWVGTTGFTGVNEMRDYRVSLELIPCNGCRIDAAINAPGSGAWHSCVTGNDCNLRDSQDYTYWVNIPYAGNWTFSMCNDDSVWDSYLYLSSACCGGVIAEADAGCGGFELSTIDCVPLQPGGYYVTIEGWSTGDCGPFQLNVFECLGSCCYGDPINPSCEYVGPDACLALGGVFSYMEPCSSGACFVRPTCNEDELTIFTQQPKLPDESPFVPYSDVGNGFQVYDDYTVPGEIGSVRFWGAWGGLCVETPSPFELSFVDSVTNVTQSYDVELTPTATGLTYFGIYPMYQYDAELFPPCTITSGWFSARGSNPAGCGFAWMASADGNGQAIQRLNGSLYQEIAGDQAFCLGFSCVPLDSVTILWQSADLYVLNWWQTQSGFVNLYTATSPNAVYPADYTFYGSLFAVPGHQSGTFFTAQPYLNAVLTVSCSGPALHEPNPAMDGVFRKLDILK